jgi:molybdopterin synthase sulfur carrier subunit
LDILTDLGDRKYGAQVITLKVKSFSVLRDIIGNEQIIVQLPMTDGERRTRTTTVGDLRRRIHELYPAISARRIVMAVAVNAKVANDESVLNDFDEIALLPPISGG